MTKTQYIQITHAQIKYYHALTCLTLFSTGKSHKIVNMVHTICHTQLYSLQYPIQIIATHPNHANSILSCTHTLNQLLP